MIFHFNPFSDQAIFFGQEPTLINNSFFGPVGLLEQFELRIGLTMKVPSQELREAAYHVYVSKYLEKHPETIISDSFRNSPLMVSRELLSWRDTLRTSGWDSTNVGVSERLDLLSGIEDTIGSESEVRKGIGDRWQAIITYDGVIPCNDMIINVYGPKKFLPYFLQNFLDRVSHDGATIEFQEEKVNASPGTDLFRIQQKFLNLENEDEIQNDSTVKILRFGDYAESVDWLASQDFASSTALISSDSYHLDLTLESLGRPSIGSSLKAVNSDVAQIFKLGCSLFERPVDIQSLMAYLRVSESPVPPSLAYSLQRVLASTGGIDNEEWESAISKYLTVDEKDKAKKRQERIKYLPVGHENAPGLSNMWVDVLALKSYVDRLATWSVQTRAIRRSNHDYTSYLDAQLRAVTDFCGALKTLLSEVEGDATIENDDLRKMVHSVYRPKSYNSSISQVGVPLVMDSPSSIIGTSDEVFWIDCFDGSPSSGDTSFLTESEREGLKKAGVLLLSSQEQVTIQLHIQRLAVLRCRERLILISPETDKGQKVSEHPLVAELKARCGVVVVAPEKISENLLRLIEPKPLPMKSVEVKLGQGLITEKKKLESESYTSLSKLIQNPFDYAMEYIVKLEDTDLLALSERDKVIGNVSHALLEQLCSDCSNDVSKIEHIVDDTDTFRRKLDKAVNAHGMLLLVDEHRVEYLRVQSVMQASFKKLLKLVRENDLSIEGCEKKYLASFEKNTELNSTIDLVLKHKELGFMIVDLKWSSRGGKFRKLIQENRALQLAVYSYALEGDNELGGKVFASSYFDLANGELYTTCNHVKGARTITPISNEDLVGLTKNSYHYRWEELRAGRLEVGEEMLVGEIKYWEDTDACRLYPLETEEEEKKRNFYSSYQTLKGMLK